MRDRTFEACSVVVMAASLALVAVLSLSGCEAFLADVGEGPRYSDAMSEGVPVAAEPGADAVPGEVRGDALDDAMLGIGSALSLLTAGASVPIAGGVVAVRRTLKRLRAERDRAEAAEADRDGLVDVVAEVDAANGTPAARDQVPERLRAVVDRALGGRLEVIGGS